MKQILVIAFGLTYAIFATMAIGKVFGAGGALVSIIAGAIAIAIDRTASKNGPGSRSDCPFDSWRDVALFQNSATH